MNTKPEPENNVQIFTWTEELAGKGSVEISSALLTFLQTLDLGNKRKIRSFSDGCISQNKNNIVSTF